MLPVRVLIIDDSVTVRKQLCDMLANCREIEVAGIASSGATGLARIPQINPDVVTLDVEMPGMTGLETLAEIRRLYPRIPVIMVSVMTELGAAVAVRALATGAADYVVRPGENARLNGAAEQVREELIGKILTLSGEAAIARPTAANLGQRIFRPTSRPCSFGVLAVGSSTGGPTALATLIGDLPEDIAVPVLVVQHMPPVFTRFLAERLNTQSKLRVREAEQGVKLAPGEVWIAPGDYHLTIARGAGEPIIVLNQEAPENSCRPAVDVMFRSVAEIFGPRTLAIVLTGMGSDGARGAMHIREAGGEVLVQDKASSVVWGMPGAVVCAGAADKICSLPELSFEIAQRLKPRTLAAAGII